jgi:hypothetical protein
MVKELGKGQLNCFHKEKGWYFEIKVIYLSIIKKYMKKVKEMIDSAMSAKDARYMLGLWHSGGSISSSQLAKGYTYIKEVWN